MTDDLFERLSAPFSPDRISWRVGSTNGDKSKGMALAYIDSRDVQQRLDEVCGPGGWQNRFPHANGKTICEIGILIDGQWIWKSDGAGDTDIEAEKGAISSAFKRAAVHWGLGRYLYDLPAPWVELEAQGRSVRIKDSEYEKLRTMLDKTTREVEWGSPGEIAATKALINTIKTVLQTEDDVRIFRDQNQGMIAQMRVKARERVNEELERICETYRAKAA